jgi:hypothetical protein
MFTQVWVAEFKKADIYRKDFSVWTMSTALHFMVVGAPFAARHIRPLTMNHHALQPISFGMKGSN